MCIRDRTIGMVKTFVSNMSAWAKALKDGEVHKFARHTTKAQLKESINEYLKIKSQEFNNVISDYLFISKSGIQLSEKYVYRTVNEYFKLVSPKVKKAPHVLRHSFATHLINEGADINSVKELLGHSSLSATQVYSHTSMERIKEVFKNSHPRAK